MFGSLTAAASLLLLLVPAAAGQDCSQPCECPSETPTCPIGTSLLLDGCGCCKVCARQVGEPCSPLEPCDHHRQLYCLSTALGNSDTGVCMAREGQTCALGGVLYHSGESFQPSCRHQCVCMNGEIGCVPTCAVNVRLPSPACPHPRRALIPGQCCEEWVCDPVPSDGRLQSSLPDYRDAPDYGLEDEGPQANCITQTTEWSVCSTTCGMGVSTRVTNDNEGCQLEKQSRVCMIRRCQAEQGATAKRGKRCQRSPKSQQVVHFQLSGCTSVRAYRPRFCGTCTDGRCCTPKDTVTGEVEFRCPEGDGFRRKMMFIKSCSCHRNCPHDNDIFLTTHLRQMSGDYESGM
ncbi:CCN family member 2-like [Brienomyrus brachyistius]|uniref:CCN family member 2-like n=1 Tax=Brienomyrus brachyistius TaxID=42636 RepID=UPI0020B30F1E|nr:CCN family member 2-like [Brienomyrus brachyistius]